MQIICVIFYAIYLSLIPTISSFMGVLFSWTHISFFHSAMSWVYRHNDATIAILLIPTMLYIWPYCRNNFLRYY